MSTLDHEFDPSKKTALDYLRELVEERDEVRKEISELRKEINILKRDLEKRNALAEEREARHRQVKWVIGIISTIIGAVGAAVLESILGRK